MTTMGGTSSRRTSEIETFRCCQDQGRNFDVGNTRCGTAKPNIGNQEDDLAHASSRSWLLVLDTTLPSVSRHPVFTNDLAESP